MTEELQEIHARKDREYHAVIAAEYEQVVNEPRAFPNELLFRPIDRLLPERGEAMLDLGCGTGQMLRRYMDRFASVTGVDHSAEMLAVAEHSLDPEQRGRTRLLRADLLEFLADEEQHYDLVSVVGCLHHLHPQSLHRAVRLAAARLAPGGKMLLAEPVLQEHMEPPTAIRRWNQKALASLPEFSRWVEEPDEAPIGADLLRSIIVAADLDVIVETRGWELFPRSLPAGFFDRCMLRALHRCYGSTGYVKAMLLEKRND